jgi:hypothetical protein
MALWKASALLDGTHPSEYEVMVGVFGAIGPNLALKEEANCAQRHVQLRNRRLASSCNPLHYGGPSYYGSMSVCHLER